MTTIAYHQYTNIPYMSGSYAGAPVNGSISHRYPLVMATHNLGVLSGSHPNPAKFGSSDGTSDFSNARSQYVRTNTTQNNFSRGIQHYSNIPSTAMYSTGTNRRYNVSQSTKYVAPASSSMYMAAKRSAAIGKSSFKQGLPDSTNLSYKSYNMNDSRSALRHVRSGGTVAPSKKGSLYNTSLCNSKTCAIGSIVQQTY
jgi:hypothetical protein